MTGNLPRSSPTTGVIRPAGDGLPRGDAAGFLRFFRADATSGFLVFLVALPLCLGISVASGFPPVAGVLTAIVGGCVTTFISNSELTIKGPAAGLIVIVLGAMQALGYTGSDANADFQAYRWLLAIGFVAGIVQAVFGLVKAGVLGEFFPSAVVHGMLAAIGCIIVLKQVPVALGRKAAAEPIEILRELPATIMGMNPAIALIGAVSLVILFGMPALKRWVQARWIKALPAQLIVLLAAVPLGMALELSREHSYTFAGHEYRLGPSFLVNVPNDLVAAFTLPDFTVFVDPLRRSTAVFWVVMLALVGNLESLLSAKAIDMVDPWRRKTDLDRDLVAVGVANVAAASIGGLPMISEIVRSKANIDNGGMTRFADLWHAVFLALAIVIVPGVVREIPMAALAAMLVYTGCRLASPREFINIYKIGREQLVIFTATLAGVLFTDLLLGVLIGVAVKLVIHVVNGLPLRSMFKPFLEVSTVDESTVRVDARGSAVFTNWLPFRRTLRQVGIEGRNNVVLNLEGTKLIDHRVMEGLHELQEDFAREDLALDIVGLEGHHPLSAHQFATRRRRSG